jgi:hypothetical protein
MMALLVPPIVMTAVAVLLDDDHLLVASIVARVGGAAASDGHAQTKHGKCGEYQDDFLHGFSSVTVYATAIGPIGSRDMFFEPLFSLMVGEGPAPQYAKLF